LENSRTQELNLRVVTPKAGLEMASRSLNVLKKNEKGPLDKYQRSFFSERNLSQQATAVPAENPKQLCH
jgi:hypothetical protein